MLADRVIVVAVGAGMLPVGVAVDGNPRDGARLAPASILAGSRLLVGNIGNLIVADPAARLGVRLGWREHARVGVPVTLLTLAVAAAWLWLRALA
ncbi:MAG TPA: hypothetical protein VFD43_07360 [Planctomycetota bacterium]|nr:hypothetical protein [Planctomycetota bacterium]